MKKTVFRYGLLSMVVMISFFLLTFAIGKNVGYDVQEILGYSGMILSLIFVFFGIKHYRDKVNEGRLSFGQGMKVGLLIVLIPAVMFGVFDVLYTTVINPNFFEDYCNANLAVMKLNMPAAEYEKAAAEMKANSEMMQKYPALQFLLMAVTVFLIGLIMTVISALILRRNKPEPAFS
jgi:ABC-type antimicrobial peptide transport system permease subunit